MGKGKREQSQQGAAGISRPGSRHTMLASLLAIAAMSCPPLQAADLAKWAKDIEATIAKQLPKKLGNDLAVAVSAAGDRVELTIDAASMATFSRSDLEKFRQGFAQGRCKRADWTTRFAREGGQFTYRYRISPGNEVGVTLNAENCRPPERSGQETMATIKKVVGEAQPLLPKRIDATLEVRSITQGPGLQIIYQYEYTQMGREQALQLRADKAKTDAATTATVKEFCSHDLNDAARVLADDGVTLTYQYQAKGVIIAAVSIDRNTCY
ncbi:MAG: hypothetical protein FIA93_08810 [Deltaproteobacteria bacterium]|nr:hypothetical protein [Deltaproteobacteria bacterium]